MPPLNATVTKHSKVSVIIPVRTLTPELREAITHLQKLDPPAYEILVFPDETPAQKLPGVTFIASGPLTPPEKRDSSLRHAAGDVLAFIDDDAYPAPNWLAQALPRFADEAIAAVGGPAITPPADSWQAQVSGAVLTSWFGSGPARNRYWPTGSVRVVDDWPSVNLIVRQKTFAAIGGFKTKSWPGDDTALCLEIIRRGQKIIYDPKMLAYHHRATTLLRHLRQVARYGLHRGYFVHAYPETSRRPSYFLPSLFTLTIITALLAAIFSPASRPTIIGLAALVAGTTLMAGLIEAFRVDKPYLTILVPPVLLATHFVYGLAFLRGLVSPKLKRYHRTTR